MSAVYGIVGGGISGLVAALRLRQGAGPDARILLFEPADRLGGVLRTETLAGQPMDIGAEAFVARRPEVPALLAELGLAGRLIGTTGVRPTLFSGGRLHPLPAGAVNGIPSTGESVAGLVDHATAARIDAEAERPMQWRPGADPAVGEVVADRFGEQVVRRSVDPMLSGVYAGSADTIGIRSAVPTVAAALDAGAASLSAAVRNALPPNASGPVFGAIDGGYRVLVDELAARSGIEWVRAEVTAVNAEGPGWTLTDDTGARHRAGAVVLATPAAPAAALLAGPAPAAAAAAARIRSASAAVLAMALPAGTPLPPQSGVLVATGEALHAKAITLSSRKWGTRGSGELLRMSFGRLGDEIAAATPHEELCRWAVEDLEAVFGINAEPTEVLVHRWLDALPQYAPGHAGLAAELRAGLPAGLAVAGNFLDGVGVPACVAGAGRAAADVLAVSAA